MEIYVLKNVDGGMRFIYSHNYNINLVDDVARLVKKCVLNVVGSLCLKMDHMIPTS